MRSGLWFLPQRGPPLRAGRHHGEARLRARAEQPPRGRALGAISRSACARDARRWPHGAIPAPYRNVSAAARRRRRRRPRSSIGATLSQYRRCDCRLRPRRTIGATLAQHRRRHCRSAFGAISAPQAALSELAPSAQHRRRPRLSIVATGDPQAIWLKPFWAAARVRLVSASQVMAVATLKEVLTSLATAGLPNNTVKSIAYRAVMSTPCPDEDGGASAGPSRRPGRLRLRGCGGTRCPVGAAGFSGDAGPRAEPLGEARCGPPTLSEGSRSHRCNIGAAALGAELASAAAPSS